MYYLQYSGHTIKHSNVLHQSNQMGNWSTTNNNNIQLHTFSYSPSTIEFFKREKKGFFSGILELVLEIK